MSKYLILALTLLLSSASHAFVKEYTESNGKTVDGLSKEAYDQFKQQTENEDKFYGGFRELYRKFNEKVVVPGFISAAPLAEIAKIVGPDIPGTNFRIGDTLYLRWNSGRTPQAGDVYALFTPAIVAQNMADPTDFSVGLPLEPSEKLPKEHRLAGYFYEGTGRVKILRVGQGLVEALLESQNGQVKIGDQLMPALPILESLKPNYGTVQLSAAIVCGSPPQRISTSSKSFIYINRGSRDGVKVGQMFEAVERVVLDSSAGGLGPENSAGEAIVVHTTDSYSTAMITRDFDVIRMGSLLRTMNPASPVVSKAPFSGMSKEVPDSLLPPSARASLNPVGKKDEIPEVPSIDDAQNNAPNLPDPMKKLPEPELSPLSELDALEKSQNFQNLTEREKARLSKLSRQERLEKEDQADASVEEDGPSMPALENSFSRGKKPAKKPSKKKKQSNDEEELNMLMMQN